MMIQAYPQVIKRYSDKGASAWVELSCDNKPGG